MQIAGEPGGDVYRLGFLREVHLEVAVSLLSAKVGLYAFLFTPMDVSAARKSGSMTMFGSDRFPERENCCRAHQSTPHLRHVQQAP